MKTFAIVASLYPPHVGGVERYSYNLAKKLADHGNRVIVITSGDGEIKEENDIKIYYMPSFMFIDGRLPILKYGRKTSQLTSVLKRENIDYFVINTRFYALSLFAARLACKMKKKAILIEHGSSHLTFNNSFLDFFVHIYEHSITYFVRRYPLKYYGVSQEACKWLNHFRIQSVDTLYNAMDLHEIDSLLGKTEIDYRKQLNLSADDFLVVYIGRLIGGKGILELNTAVGKLLKENPKVHLVIAGDGPLFSEIESQKTDNTHMLGRITYDKVIALLNAADVFCLPSESEGFPTSVLEAVACKCFVITTKAGGSKELITGREYGIILDDNKPETIYKALNSIIDDKEYRIQAEQKCYERLKENFTWDVVSKKVETIFENK